MTEDQRYLFDLNGYLHLKNVMTEEEVAAAREAAKQYVETDEADLPKAIQNRLSPETLELTARAGYKEVKEIVNQDVVTLTV